MRCGRCPAPGAPGVRRLAEPRSIDEEQPLQVDAGNRDAKPPPLAAPALDLYQRW